MTGDLQKSRGVVFCKMAARFSVAELVSTSGVSGARSEWYIRIGASLDALPNNGWLYVSRFRLPLHPARYVWVDRHMRVWRADDHGRLRVSATLSSTIC
jgi:hypothetical protein